MKTFVALPILGLVLWASVHAGEQTETTAGWVKHAENPVLGGDLGTCFDISVLKEGDTYRMWFSWRPKKSIALVESKDGVQWSKPVIVLGPNKKTDWENDLNRPVVIKNGDRYQMWYTGQARGKSWIGYATSKDGVTWERRSDRPVLSAEKPWVLSAPCVRVTTLAEIGPVAACPAANMIAVLIVENSSAVGTKADTPFCDSSVARNPFVSPAPSILGGNSFQGFRVKVE